jgi:hypothetical protein
MKDFFRRLLELKTDTVLGTVIAGLIVPAILFLVSLIRTRLRITQLLPNIKRVFNFQIRLYVVCLLIALLLIVRYIVLNSNKGISPPKSNYFDQEQKQLSEMESLESTKIGDYTYKEINELLNSEDDRYFGITSFMDFRDSLNSQNGSKLKWHDSNNNEMEILNPDFKKQLLRLKLIKSIDGNKYMLTENGQLFFNVTDKIKAHRYMYYSLENKRIQDSLASSKTVK